MQELGPIKNALRELDFSNFPDSIIHLGSSGVWLAVNPEELIVHGLDPEGNVVTMPYPNAPDLIV